MLELCLLVAVRQISELTCGEPFNFEMVYSGRQWSSVAAVGLLCGIYGCDMYRVQEICPKSTVSGRL